MLGWGDPAGSSGLFDYVPGLLEFFSVDHEWLMIVATCA